MKIIYTFIILGCLQIAEGQTFLKNGRKWIFEHTGFSANPSAQKIDSIMIVGDTVINNQTYKKLIASAPHPCGIFGGLEFLREENEKIYQLRYNMEEEWLMVDFKATDTYQLPYTIKTAPPNSATEIGIALIDSFGIYTAFDNTKLKAQYLKIENNLSFDDETSYMVLDKVGFFTESFLFPNLGTGLCDVWSYFSLRCVVDEDSTIQFTDKDCREIVSNTQQVSLDDGIIYPNPSSNFIHWPKEFVYFSLQDVNGKYITIDAQNHLLNIANLRDGIYFLKLKNTQTEKMNTQRIVKQ